ncbi:MAG: acyl carrier protein [Deltaproteobacteria bacterium]|nr:acyl carrier protein [Deltaproteobacteria bacterium]
MSTTEQLVETFHRIASDVCERELPKLEASTMISDLGLDSLQVLEIVGAMERELKVTIPDDQLVGIQSVNDLVGLLQRRLA